MSRRAARRAWEDWAHVDPFWAILTDPETRHGRTDVRAFFETGRVIVESLLEDARALGRPARHDAALDFGCGVGRLTRALAPHFEVTYGLDIAPTMITQAEELNADISGCRFIVHDDDDFRRFDDASIDFITCLLVLQHFPDHEAIETQLREFVRVLSPGGVAVFQLPTHIPAVPLSRSQRARFAIRDRGTRLLRRLGINRRFLYRSTGWQPAMPMTAIPEQRVHEVAVARGGSVLEARRLPTDHGGVESNLYFVAPAV